LASQCTFNLRQTHRQKTRLHHSLKSPAAFGSKVAQLTLERNLGEAVRWLRALPAQFHFDTEYDKGSYQTWLAFTQRLAGDTAGAKVTAEQARNTLEQLYRDQPDNPGVVESLSHAYATMGEKDSALKAAERAIMLVPPCQRSDGWTSLRRELGANSDARRREQPCDLNSHPAVTNAT
jgi:tetratricopeptide (TPR) repeat protein